MSNGFRSPKDAVVGNSRKRTVYNKDYVDVGIDDIDMSYCTSTCEIHDLEKYIVDELLPKVDMDRFCDLFFEYYEKCFEQGSYTYKNQECN